MTSPRSVWPPTPGAGLSMTSMTVVSTGICATCVLPAVSGGRFFSAAGFFALMPARRTVDFAFFGVARFAANLRAGLALTLPRFELFLRAATRFFALAMAISCKACRRQGHLNTSALCCLNSKRFATSREGRPCLGTMSEAVMLAHGFSVDLMGLGRPRAHGNEPIEVTRVRITDAGEHRTALRRAAPPATLPQRPTLN